MNIKQSFSSGLIRVINTVIRPLDRSLMLSIPSLTRIIKKLIHPQAGEAWLETINKEGNYDPHLHVLIACDTADFKSVYSTKQSRLRYVSKNRLVFADYHKELKSWDELTAIRAYNADQLKYDKNCSNQFIYSNLN